MPTETADASSASIEDRNTELVKTFIREFWNEGDQSSPNRLLADDYVDHSYQPPTAQGLVNTHQVLVAAFPDQRSVIEDTVAQGEQVMVRMVLRGTHLGPFRGTAPTGKAVAVNVFRQYRLAAGKIVEHRALLDTASLLRQIGAMPDP